MPFFALLSASGFAGVMAATALVTPGGGFLATVLRVVCSVPLVGLFVMLTYLVWISMGPMLLALMWIVIIALIFAMRLPLITRRIGDTPGNRTLIVSLVAAIFLFGAALAYLVLLTQLGYGGRLRLI